MSILNNSVSDNTLAIDNSQVDAFGNFTVESATPIVAFDFVSGLQRAVKTKTVGTNSAVTNANSMGNLVCGTALNDYAAMISAIPLVYRDGQGSEAKFTTVYAAPQAGLSQLWGVANVDAHPTLGTYKAVTDGYHFGYYVGTDSTATAYNGTVFGILHTNSVGGVKTERFYPESQWTGGSTTWDKTKGVPVRIRYPFQGFANILFDINIDGTYRNVHTIEYTNKYPTPQLQVPNLRFHGVIERKTAGGTTATMSCGSVKLSVFGAKRYTAPNVHTSIFAVGGAVTGGVAWVQCASLFNNRAVSGVCRLSEIRITANTVTPVAASYRILKSPSWTGMTLSMADSSAVPAGTASTTLVGGLQSITASGTNNFAVNPLLNSSTIYSSALTGENMKNGYFYVKGETMLVLENYLESAGFKEMPSIGAGETLCFVLNNATTGGFALEMDFILEP
jgi:hypothetical protein